MILSMSSWVISGWCGWISKRRSKELFGCIRFCFLMYCFYLSLIKLFLLMLIKLFEWIWVNFGLWIFTVRRTGIRRCAIIIKKWKVLDFGNRVFGEIIYEVGCIILVCCMLWILIVFVLWWLVIDWELCTINFCEIRVRWRISIKIC